MDNLTNNKGYYKYLPEEGKIILKNTIERYLAEVIPQEKKEIDNDFYKGFRRFYDPLHISY